MSGKLTVSTLPLVQHSTNFFLPILTLIFCFRDNQCDFFYWWVSYITGVVFALITTSLIALQLHKLYKLLATSFRENREDKTSSSVSNSRLVRPWFQSQNKFALQKDSWSRLRSGLEIGV